MPLKDLEAQREYAECMAAGIGFSARPDMWLYRYETNTRLMYRACKPNRDIILEIDDENLGLDWMTELEQRARRSHAY
jgi:hypothetical protein